MIRDSFSESAGRDLATERAVVIPDTIRDFCVPPERGRLFSSLERLATAVREAPPRRPLIFVGTPTGVGHRRRDAPVAGRRRDRLP